MARPKKVGLGYFPLDCQMDDKVEMLEAEHGIEGFAVYIKLLQTCYQFEDGKLDMSVIFRWKTLGKSFGISAETLQQIVDTMLVIGLFDRKVFQEEQKLTSNGIQKRINDVDERRNKDRQRKAPNTPSDNPSFPAENPSIPGDDQRKSAQKEKEKEIDNIIPVPDVTGEQDLDATPVDPAKPTAPVKVNYPQEFEVFWKQYAKPTGSKKDAYGQWQKLKPEGKEKVMEVLPNYLNHQPDPVYRKDADRFIKSRMWESDFSPLKNTMQHKKEMVY